jgi:hypothetical protein
MARGGFIKPGRRREALGMNLTSPARSVIRAHMDRKPLSVKQGRSPRWLSVALLLAVSFLPLHFHAATAAASQLTQECSCLHGTRTEMGLTAVAAQCVSPLPIALLELFEPEPVSQSLCNFQSIRAPPIF